MPVIDDQGRIFGTINVIDALAVLLVLAVVAAGAALVLAPAPEPTEPDLATISATIDLGAQPEYVVNAIEVGDTYSPAGDSTLTITDIYLSPQDGQQQVRLGVELEGPRSGDHLQYDGAPPRLGRNLTIVTDSYQISGTLVELGSTPTGESTEIVVTDTVSTATASAIEVGDTYQLGSQTLGTVESVSVYGTQNPDRKRVYVGLKLNALSQGDHHSFAGTALREGATIPFETADYRLNGTIHRTGALEQRGSPSTRSVTLQLRNVTPRLANSIQPGMTERTGETTIAVITSVDRSNATVILTSQDGQIYEREHPRNQDLTITADLRVRQTTNGVTFKGETIQQGSTVVLDFGSITVRATVVGL